MSEAKIKRPTELLVSPRNSGGLYCAVAKTIDEGAASVVWDFDTKDWVFAKDFPVGTVFAAIPLSPELMEKCGIAESQSYLDFVADIKK